MWTWIQCNRIWISRGIVLAFLPLLLFTYHSWPRGSGLDIALSSLGQLFVAVGVMGRIWATVHIVGRKDQELVTTGPYSFCRNPLYLFSGFILLGVLCVLENVLLVIPVGSLLLITYVVTVRQEELFLSEKFREAYAAYARDVPRILPAFRKYRRDTRERVEVNLRLLLRGIGDASFALLVPPAAQLLEHFHTSGVLPIWFHV